MVYNPRMSIAPSSQQSRSRRREDEVDAFMRLSDDEIVGCIADIGIPFSVGDLQKPNPVQIQQIYEWFADVLLNANRQTVDPCMRAAAEDICGEFVDSFPADTRNLMGFYMSLRKLLDEVGIHDFSFSDLFRPTHDRLSRIFSYVINFVRFRESQAAVIEKYSNRTQKIKTHISELSAEIQHAEDRLEAMRESKRAMEMPMRQKMQRNDELKHQLLDLQRSQQGVRVRLEEAKTKKNELTGLLEEKTAQRLLLKQEIAKLRPYTLQSPQALQQALGDLTKTLSADKTHIDSLDRRARGLQTSIDSFGIVATDVASCIRLLDEISAELAKEEDENTRNSRQRDALSERGNNVKEVERTEALLQRQLQKWNERTEKLRETSAAKAAEAKEKMADLKKVYRKLTDENAERGREMERQRVRIEQTEKKMLDLKENIENEVHSAYDEYLKMESHIKLYITEMEQSLPS